MEPIESSENSAYNNTLTPGTYPKEKKLQVRNCKHSMSIVVCFMLYSWNLYLKNYKEIKCIIDTMFSVTLFTDPLQSTVSHGFLFFVIIKKSSVVYKGPNTGMWCSIYPVSFIS